MTEYGRGPGSEPWHPGDPLYGDPGWNGHEAQQGQMPYGGPQQQYPQEPQYQQQQYAQHQQGPYPDQMQGYPAPQQMHPHGPQHAHAHPQQQTYGGQPWDTGQGQYAMADPQAPQAYPEPEPQAHDAYPAADPYAGAEPYAQQPAGGYPGEAPDTYGTEESYPPPEPPGRRRPAPDPEAEPEGDEDDEDEDTASGADAGRGGRRGGRSKGKGKGKDKPKRSGAACLVASLVIVGLVGGGGYYGYNYLKARFGAAEDYTGEGTSESVEVQIPNGAGLMAMGRILKEHGVVASTEAFVAAATANTKGTSIQPGVYTLKKKMSAAAAVKVMIDPSKLNVLVLPEGKRAVEVYEMIDKKLQKPAGTTAEIAKRDPKGLGLPAWAADNQKIKDPLEGFLFPARYDVTKETTPETLLKQMVRNASDQYANLGFEAKAKSLGLDTPLQLVTVASLVQVEGNKHDDFRKMSEVIYNRLKKTNDVTNQKLEFDSTINYLKGTNNINVSRDETRKLDNPYNTYLYKGLTPGPISNPGSEALNAALDPDKGGWMFFVSVDGNTTTFTKTFAEHEKLVAEFNARQKQQKTGG
ncbi:endolytic transglycosylase MltG [Streptomyces sp. NPDC101206]|uniref:endolytic transglycosylase MltG n=1 Tax=Streptomyces sp. NPDC101206 TaxID=3366128 RepID=UPI003813AD2C